MESNKESIIFFSDKTPSKISQVGGKGNSLHKLSFNGIFIPFGFILTVSFFQEIKEKIKNSDEWKSYLKGKIVLNLNKIQTI